MTSRPGSGTVRRASLGGVIGPVAFIGAWLLGAITTSMSYSSIDDAISRLAAVDADTRWLMTAGFIAFGIAVPFFGLALRRHVGGWGWVGAIVTGLATLGVAATPLDRSDTVDTLHGAFATAGYVALIAVPIGSFGALRQSGNEHLATAGAVAAAVSSIALVLTVTGLPTGFFQRLGLTATDLWMIAMALLIASSRLGTSHAEPDRSST